MRALPYILLLILAAGLLYMWMDADSGHEREVLKLKKELYYTRDSMNLFRDKAEEWRKTALDYGNQQRKDATKAMQFEQMFLNEKAINEILKKRPVVRYSDSSLDSLFLARYSR